MTSPVSRDERHTPQHPCEVCGGHERLPRGQGKRCVGFTNGLYCRCSREEHAGALPGEEVSGTVLYRHYLSGACRCGTTHRPASPGAYGDDVEATYDYRDERGELLFQVVRRFGKRFSQRRPDGAGGWVWNLQGVRRVPYRLPELLQAPADAVVHVAEGEKDVDRLRKAGLVATCNPGGAGKWSWVAGEVATLLRGRAVVVLSDADDVGRKHARQVAASLRDVASSVATLEPPAPFKDVADLLSAGHELSECIELRSPTLEVARPLTNTATPPSDHPAWEDTDSGRLVLDDGDDTRPEVKLYAELHLGVDALDDALARYCPDVYQRAASLVEVVPAAKLAGAADGTPTIHELSKDGLALRISRNFRCVRWKEDRRALKQAISVAGVDGDAGPRGEWAPAPPSGAMLSAMLAARQWQRIRPLVSVTESPVLRADGSVLQSPGYDAASGYLYRPNADFSPVEDSPTQSAARAALEELREVFCDFPYVSPSHALVPIAALLTVVARPAIRGPTPLFVFEASMQGSGKTLQAECAHMIATGRRAAMRSFPVDESEREKTLGAVAMASPSVALFDNVKGLLGGGKLEGILTGAATSFRLLGVSQEVELPWLTVVMVTGNNMQMTDDVIRRSLLARLVPTGDPTERTGFRHSDLLGWCRQERPRLLRAALTILRSFLAHGSPETDAGTLASFPEWSRLVPAALRFAGATRVLEARPDSKLSGSDESEGMATLLRLWHLLPDPGGSKTVRGLIRSLYPAPNSPDGLDELRDALETVAPGKGSQPDPVKLGYAMKRARDKWFWNRCLVRDGSSDGATRYRLQARDDTR